MFPLLVFLYLFLIFSVCVIMSLPFILLVCMFAFIYGLCRSPFCAWCSHCRTLFVCVISPYSFRLRKHSPSLSLSLSLHGSQLVDSIKARCPSYHDSSKEGFSKPWILSLCCIIPLINGVAHKVAQLPTYDI